jgi:hypothetical protein
MLKSFTAIMFGLPLAFVMALGMVSGVPLVAQSSAQTAPYHVVTVSDGGTIAGIVKWSGAVPPAATMPISKDPEVCDPHSHKHVPLDRLVIGPQGGVANTVVFLQNISAGKDFPPEMTTPLLDQVECRYKPHVVLVPQNSDLKIRSSDSTLHTVHMEGAATYNFPFPFANKVSTATMSSPGLVNVKCNGGHVWMNAEIWVIAHPYYAITDESGKFVLNDVPPGQYELVAWHEGWTIVRHEGTIDVLAQRVVQRPLFGDPKTWEQKVTVRPKGETAVEFEIPEK